MADYTLPHSVSTVMPEFVDVSSTISHLEDLVNRIEARIPDIKKASVADAARFFVCYHRINALLDDLGKKFGGGFEEFKVEILPSILDIEGQSSVPLDDGFRVGVQQKLYASIKGGKRDEAFDWLRENGLEDVITETVNASTLSAAVKVMIEDHFKEPPAEVFNLITKANSSVTKTKPKK